MSHVSCDGCGQCCTNQSSPPIMPDELEALPQNLRDEITTYLDSPNYDDSAPCIWLGPDKRCKHYEHRPQICRDYPVAGENCHRERTAIGLTVEGWPLVKDEAVDD